MLQRVFNHQPNRMVNVLLFTLILSLSALLNTCKNPAADMKAIPMTSDQKELVLGAKLHRDWCGPECHLQHISLETDFRQKFRTASQQAFC